MWIIHGEEKIVSEPLAELLREAAFIMMQDICKQPDLLDDQEYLEDLTFLSFQCQHNELFANLTLPQQVYAIHFVLGHMLDKESEAPRIEMWMEAAIGMLLNRVEQRVLKSCKSSRYDIRKLVIDAFRHHNPREDMMEAHGEIWDESCELAYARGAHRSKDRDFWSGIVEELREVLLEDRDFECLSIFDGMEAERADLIRKMLGFSKETQPPSDTLILQDLPRMIRDLMS